jgi:hypothetical protein
VSIAQFVGTLQKLSGIKKPKNKRRCGIKN